MARGSRARGARFLICSRPPGQLDDSDLTLSHV